MPKRLPLDPRTARNRFGGGGVAVVGEDFTDRSHEVGDIARGLATPRGHLLVTGRRRIGKTSVLLAARDERIKTGQPVLYIDLWSTSTLEDMTTRLAKEASTTLGPQWTGLVKSFASRLKFTFELSPVHGTMLPVPRVELRDAPVADQRKRLVEALDLLEEMAKKHKTHLGVIIDEFQEIERLGSEGTGDRAVSAMKSVRAAIQRHRHVTYVFAGSDRRLIEKLSTEDNGALYNIARTIDIGPIDPRHFATWLEDEFTAMGMHAMGLGLSIIAAAGPRTRDVRTLAETLAELGRDHPTLTPALIDDAMRAVVRQRSGSYEAFWKDQQLTKVQQNLLRAAAAVGNGLTRREIIEKYGLVTASATVKAIDRLEERSVVLRDGTQVLFDDPFLRAWVVLNALPDVGDQFPVTHVPPQQ